MIQKRTYDYSELYKTKIQELTTKASIALQEAHENSCTDISSIKDLIIEATENPGALEKLAELACDEQTNLYGTMKLWEISGDIRDYSHRKQEEINKVTAMMGSILSDWCCGRARTFGIYLSRYYNGWFNPLVSDDNAK